MNGCEHADMEVVGGMGVCTVCGTILVVTGQTPHGEPVMEEAALEEACESE